MTNCKTIGLALLLAAAGGLCGQDATSTAPTNRSREWPRRWRRLTRKRTPSCRWKPSNTARTAPTSFGTLAYEVASDADQGKIHATVEIPARKAARTVVLRLRHLRGAPIQGVTVNSRPWTDFDRDRETIELAGLTGTVAVTAAYAPTRP